MSPLEILYLAFGYRFLVMAINSARSARAAGTQCKLITNLPLKRAELGGERLFDKIVVVSALNGKTLLEDPTSGLRRRVSASIGEQSPESELGPRQQDDTGVSELTTIRRVRASISHYSFAPSA